MQDLNNGDKKTSETNTAKTKRGGAAEGVFNGGREKGIGFVGHEVIDIDVDGDGLRDLFYGTATGGSRVLRNAGTHFVDETAMRLGGLVYYHGLVAGDVDGDGDTDVMAMSTTLLLRNQGGTFAPAPFPAIPGLAYGIWARTPGTHNSPFGWDMTLGFWQQWLTIPILYLAAFQSGLQDARWYGTRLLPVVAAGALCLILAIIPHWWFIGLPLSCVTVTVQTLTLFHSMQARDFA